MAKKKAAKKPSTASTALAVRKHDSLAPASSQALAMIERFATNPDFDVEKMKALMEMREREMLRVAEQAFNAAMAAAQASMRPVARDADNKQTSSRYATYTALDNALRPIYAANNFGLSFNTGDSPKPESVLVLCDVSHAGGFSKSYHIDMPADGKGAKGGDVMTKTHATGSAVSYGMRYLLKMIFNVAIGEFDDDGNKAGVSGLNRRPAPPTRREPAEPVYEAEVSSRIETPTDPNKITPEQRASLGRVAKTHNRNPAEVTKWLKDKYHVGSSAGLLQTQFNDVKKALEAKGPLPMAGDGGE